MLTTDDKLKTVEWRLTIIEKIAIPVAIGLLSFIIATSANKISQAQLELAKQQELSRVKQAETELDAKYVEIFYREVFSGEKNRQLAALKVLEQQRPALRLMLAGIVQSLANTPEVTQQASAVLQNASALILQGFTLNLFYLETNHQSEKHAERVANALRDRRNPARIRVQGVSQTFLDDYEAPIGNEVRYEEPYEVEQSKAVLAELNSVDPNTTYTPAVVANRTPNLISIFFDPKEK